MRDRHDPGRLIELGWNMCALAVLEDVEARVKLRDRPQRAAEAETYRWAMEQLAALRGTR